MLKHTGIATAEELSQIKPDCEQRQQGPVAWIECFHEIPCDPCHEACPVEAIKPFSDINHLPSIEHEDCTGCGMCVANCPGLAVFVIDETYSNTHALMALPHEFTPVPEPGDEVVLMTRAGEQAGTSEVQRVQNPKSFDRTAVVWVEVPQNMIEQVRAIKPLHQAQAKVVDSSE